jgi:hypothetical protein
MMTEPPCSSLSKHCMELASIIPPSIRGFVVTLVGLLAHAAAVNVDAVRYYQPGSSSVCL